MENEIHLRGEFNDMLSAFADKHNKPAEQLTDPTTAGVIGTTAAATETAVSEIEQPTVDIKPEPVAEVATVKEEVKADESIFDDWDKPLDVAAPAAEVKVDTTPFLTELSKAIGSEVKSVEDVKKYIDTVVKKDVLEDVPADLKKAVELARKGANYLEFLEVNKEDYSKADPKDLYEDYLYGTAAQNGELTKEEADKIDEYLESLSDFEKEIRGKDVQRRLISEQTRRTQELEQEAVRNRERHDGALRSALKGLSDVDGFKVSDTHRNAVFDWVSSGKIMKDLFYDGNGDFDASKAAKVGFLMKYHEQMTSYSQSKIRNTTKREILKDVTNADVKKTTTNTHPTKENKGFGYDDMLLSLTERLNNGR